MEYTGLLKVLPIVDLQHGQIMTIVLTSATQVPVLEFLNAGDTTWRTQPGFVGTLTSGVLVQELRCISGRMRLNFASQPASNYHMSLTLAAAPTF